MIEKLFKDFCINRDCVQLYNDSTYTYKKITESDKYIAKLPNNFLEDDKTIEIRDSGEEKFLELIRKIISITNDSLNVFYFFEKVQKCCNRLIFTNHPYNQCSRDGKDSSFIFKERQYMSYILGNFIIDNYITDEKVITYKTNGPIYSWTYEKENITCNQCASKEKFTENTKFVGMMGGQVEVNQSLDNNQVYELIEALNVYSEQFAFDENHIGLCNISEMKIDIGDARPIHQNP